MSAKASARGRRRQWLEATVALSRSGALALSPMATGRVISALGRHGATPASLLAVSAARYPDRVAIIDDEGSLTFAELYQATVDLAVALRESNQHISSVGVLCRNHRGFVIGFLASAMIGSDTVSINTELPASQLAALLNRHTPDVVLHDLEFTEALHASDFGGRCICIDSDSDRDAAIRALRGSRARRNSFARSAGRITLLTSGTTGLAKGVPRTVRPMGIAQLAATGAARGGLRSGDVALIGPPFFHGFGLLALLGAIALGVTTVTHRTFAADGVLRDLERHRVTIMFAVPVMIQRILDAPSAADVARRSSLRVVATGAAPITEATVVRFREMFGDILVNGYGSTEAGVVSIATAADLAKFPATAGRAALGVSIRIIDDDGNLAPSGISGRILVRGPLGYSGYTPDRNGVTHHKDVVDGYVDTGDVGYVDRTGLLFLRGRSDDMIVSGGENVFPLEVEQALTRHCKVADAAVIGVDDEEFGQVLRAFVVARDDANAIERDELSAYLRGIVERYKIPKQFFDVSEIPRNPSGKTLRRELLTQSIREFK
ncbi:AMP-binding protein [Gordonia sp. L191]|nr:AMP-binding protein [Gordonia sp. L191]WHU46496.1 AMP-binding protein [Gordonia sp. L191]